jgi:hypothetical protein
MLKLKINDLKRKLHMLKQQTSNIDVLRNEVYHLQVGRDTAPTRVSARDLRTHGGIDTYTCAHLISDATVSSCRITCVSHQMC